MKKLTDLLCPFLFCAFLFSTSLILLLSRPDMYSQREKRYLAQMEKASWSDIKDGTFQEKLENWIEDQFPGRDMYVAVDAYSMLLSGRNSQQSNYYAKDGFLIGAPNAADTAQFERNLERIDQFAASCDVPVSMIMVPTTGWLHNDLLPVSAKAYLDDDCFDAAGKVKNINFLDLRPNLLQADTQKDVAYRTDHHLTAWGNYALYCAWCEEKGITASDPEDYKIEVFGDFYGTSWSGSGYWLTDPDEIEIWDRGKDISVTITDGGEEPVCSDSMFFRDHLAQPDKYPVYLDGNHTLTQIDNPSADGGTVLLIKDSYAHCFAPFLTEHYSKVILLDLRFYRGSVSEFITDNHVDEVLFVYGVSTLLTDTNSAWLF